LKTAYRDEVERLYRGGLDTVRKGHFTSLYKPARERALTKRNIMAGWAATGLFPFNPDRVLRHTPKPSAELTLPKAREVMDLQDEPPITPVTPVTKEAVTSLHNLIKQELNEPSKLLCVQRHVQKLASAAQKSFAEKPFLQDQNLSLSTLNSEAKVRRSTRSTILGKAKVMSYEDLEGAKTKRAAKEKATEGKGKRKRGRPRKTPAPEEEAEAEVETEAEAGGKRGRKKRKSLALEAGAEAEAEAGSPELEAGSSVPKDKVTQMNEVEPPWKAPVARISEFEPAKAPGAPFRAPGAPFRAPVARMY
jgi:hypothetical protein